ncbi:response regulator transcription factor [Cohnella caldifontis]|uniref:response regulator transcription factor n=1 Tax=Cohnella caldifontis TaxID=3027471 RepID=UPI0023ED4D5C|nr:response regulator [Cohnella sp. YIM B05605]
MYKMLIVDDEPEIRSGLRYLDWGSVGVEAVGECEHGLEACQWLEQHAADLILTDIRMPVMNGLELAEHVAKRYGHIKTVVLSGYNDFELARESMRRGTLDYLLKPINPDELLSVVSSAVETLRKEGQQRENQKRLERKVRQSTKLLRQQFLRRLLFQSVDPDEMEEGCAAAELLLEDRRCAVGVLKLDLQVPWEQAYTDKDRKLILFACDNVISDLWDEAGSGYHFVEPSEGVVYLVMALDPSDPGEPLPEKMSGLKQHLKKFRGLFRTTISIAFGSEQEPGSLDRSLQQALAVMAQAGSDAMAIYDGGLSTPGEPTEQSAGKADTPQPAAEEGGKPAHYVVNAAKAYVQAHYDRVLTLQEVAQHVHINASYLSYLFKEVTGDTFVHFLTSLRIRRAKELLQDPQYKVYEIGQIVGYENPRYFAEIFKKHTGKTPYEYRCN